MPSPSAALVTLRPDLAASFEAFDLEASQAGFAGLKVLPISEVASQMGNYGYIPPNEILVDADDTRAPGSGYSRSKGQFKALTFNCQEHGHEELVDDREAKAYANYFDAESWGARRARDTVLRNAEKRIAARMNDYHATNDTGTRNFTVAAYKTAAINGANGNALGVQTGAWTVIATCDPVLDVLTGVNTVYQNCGKIPNLMVITFKQLLLLRQSTLIKAQVKYSGLDDPKMSPAAAISILEGLFGMSIVVAGAQYAANNQAQAINLASIWSDSYVLLACVAKSQDFRELCVGRTFHWGADGSSPNGTVESYREEDKRSNVIRVRNDVDEQVIAPFAAYLITGVA